MKQNQIKGIYLIEVTTPNYVARYVGQSKEIYVRWNRHRKDLKRGCHGNSILQNYWNKYGSGAFKFSVLETCADIEANIDEREKFWIKYHKSFVWDGERGCNLCDPETHEISAETRKKMSEARKGNISEEQRKKLSESMKGNKYATGNIHTEETRKKISEANKRKKGKKRSEETRKKISEAMKGNKSGKGNIHTEETRKKISEANKGKKRSEETRKKISEANKARSEETRKKISEANKRRIFSEETRKKMSESRKLYCEKKKAEFGAELCADNLTDTFSQSSQKEMN